MKKTLFAATILLTLIALKTNAQVGIGVDIPTKDLDINGELRIRTLPAAATSDYLLTTDANGNIKAASTDQLKADISAGPWYLEGSTTTRASANGDKMWHEDFVGIFPNAGSGLGTVTDLYPAAPLHIKASVTALVLQDHNDSNAGNVTMNFIDEVGTKLSSLYVGSSANSSTANNVLTLENHVGNVRLKTGSYLAVLNSNTGDFTLNGSGGSFVPDYVFQKEFDGYSSINNDYSKMNLEEVEDHIKTHYHLPGVDSHAKVQKEGLALDKMLYQVLEKVEELYLHTIELNKRIEELEQNQKNNN